jgi:aminoglycoside 6'-N-acetyltransferase
MSEQQSLDFLSQMSTANAPIPGTWIQLGIALPETDLLVGDIGLFLDQHAEAAEIGFTLAREYQSQGLATQAVALVVESLFASRVMTKVRGITDARNAASIRLLERAGFSKVSQYDTTFKGEVCTEYVFEKRRHAG